VTLKQIISHFCDIFGFINNVLIAHHNKSSILLIESEKNDKVHCECEDYVI